MRATTSGRLAVFPAVVLAFLASLGLVIVGLAWAPLLAAMIIPLTLALARRPQRGILVVVALAPFDGLLLIAGFPELANGWKETLVIATLVATFVCPIEAHGAPGRRLPGWAPAVAGLLLLASISAVLVGGDRAVEGMKIGFFYLLAGWAAWRCPLGRRDRDRLVTILMGTGFVTAVIGLAQQVMSHAALHELGYEYDTAIRFASGFTLRSFSTFEGPFPFGLFLMLVILVGLPAALADHRRLRNRLFLLALPIYGLGLLSAFVRAAWLGLAIGLLYLGFRRYRIVLAGIPLAFVAFLLVGTSLAQPLLSSTSLEARTHGWGNNLSAVVAQPLGAGLGSAGVVAELVTGETATGRRGAPFQPDNYYFKTLYELGVLGLWFLVLLLVSTFLASHRAANRRTGNDRALADGVAASILAAMAASLVSTYFEIFPMDLLFWVLVVVVATADQEPGAAVADGDPELSEVVEVAPRR